MKYEDAILKITLTDWDRAKAALRLGHTAATTTDELWELWTMADEIYDRLLACKIALAPRNIAQLQLARDTMDRARTLIHEVITEIEAGK